MNELNVSMGKLSLDAHLTKKKLTRHIEEKACNNKWLQNYINPLITEAKHFPYFPKGKGEGKFNLQSIAPLNQNNILPELDQSRPEDPFYLVTIPFVPGVNRATPANYTPFIQMITKLKDESFGQTSIESREKILQKIVVVVGMNRMESLDSKNNISFFDYVKNLPAIEGVSYRVFGKMWVPECLPNRLEKNKLYSRQKAYMILKNLNAKAAFTVLKLFESNHGPSETTRGQIPYQRVREALKTHNQTQSFFDYVKSNHPNTPIYLATMDDDFKALREEEGEGLFSCYDKITQEYEKSTGELPHIVTTGYGAHKDELPMYRIGVDLDMHVREAMASVIPMAPYYPEPSFLLLLRENLSSYSFIGKGNNLESRRLMENGIRSGLIDPNKCVFKAIRALMTTIPARMRTQSCETVATINRGKIGQKNILKALRGISQTHLFPKKWAENLYLSLPASPTPRRMTDVTKPLTAILKVFDPIAQTSVLPIGYGGIKYNQRFLQDTINNYDNYVEYIRLVRSGEKTLDEAMVLFSALYGDFDPQGFKDLFSSNYNILQEAIASLTLLGLSEEWRIKVLECAKKTGETVKNYLAAIDL